MITKTFHVPKKKVEVPFELVQGQRMLLMPIGDVHYGTKNFPRKRLVDHLRWGMDRGAYFLGMGEYLDLVSFSQRQVLGGLRDSIKEQLDELITAQANEFLNLIDFTKGKWLGLLEGDHRWDFQTGTSVDQYICKGLRSDFLGTSTRMSLSFNGSPDSHPESDCIVYAHHGIGSSRTQGGQLNQVESLLKVTSADIYLMGHSHGKVAAGIDFQDVTPDGVHYHRTKFVARTGAWLRGYVSHEPISLNLPVIESRGSYIEQRVYTPAALGGLCFGIGYERIDGSKYYRPKIHCSI
jgi:hypothetical protein